MSDIERGQWRAEWRALSVQNGWTLAPDEEQLLDQALAEYQTLHCRSTPQRCRRLALMRAYGLHLYAGLQAGRELALNELWQTCYRLSRARGLNGADAQDIAQEMTVRVLQQVARLRSPQSCLLWALTIQRNVEKALTRRNAPLEPLARDAAQVELPDPRDMAQTAAARIEGRLLIQRMRALLNDLELLIVVRWVVLDDRPREIASDLGLKSERVRVIKSRALQKLARDDEFLRLLRTIV